eukprot:11399929-Karenia_brevis.AAC.1
MPTTSQSHLQDVASTLDAAPYISTYPLLCRPLQRESRQCLETIASAGDLYSVSLPMGSILKIW